MQREFFFNIPDLLPSLAIFLHQLQKCSIFHTPWEVFLSPWIMLFFWFIPLKTELWTNYQLLKGLPEFFNKKATLTLATHIPATLSSHPLFVRSLPPPRGLSIRKQTHFSQTITFLSFFYYILASTSFSLKRFVCLFAFMFYSLRSNHHCFSDNPWVARDYTMRSNLTSGHDWLSVYKTLF